jgi:hypothetical protein
MATSDPTTHFWNAGGTELITGLDVLGVREYDQKLEQEWVAGITTISLRARYMTLLPWVFGVFYRRYEDKVTGAVTCTEDDWRLVLTRLTFLTNMATNLGHRWGEAGRVYGTIGNIAYRPHLREIQEKGAIAIPESPRNATILGTYIMPCAAFGIINTNFGVDKPPVILTARGQRIFELRQRALEQNPLVDLLFSSGTLTLEMLEEWGHGFSLNGFNRAYEELDALRDAFFRPYHPSPSVKAVYRRFTQSVDWLLTRMGQEDGDHAQISEEILARNYRDTVGAGVAIDETARAWAEYELRRRIHFSLEVLMSAFCRTLRSEFADTGATVEEIVARWVQMPIDQERFAHYCVSTVPALTMPLGDFADACNDTAFRPPFFPWGQIEELSSAERAWYALALLLVCRQDAAVLDAHTDYLQILPDPFRGLVFELLDAHHEQPVDVMLVSLLEQAVVVAHLDTTMRKMGAGQKCSLRVYPEGRVLHPLPNNFGPGFSNDRLSSVMGMLADLGFCRRIDNAAFGVDEETTAVYTQWRAAHAL